MLVRSPLLTIHKWRELVSSRRLVYRCHGVFSGVVTFVLFCFVFRPYAFVEAVALCSAVLRYAAYVFIFLSFFLSLFPSFFFVPFPLSLCIESTSYVLSFRMVFFYLMTTGWVFYISLCENLINQSKCGLPKYHINISVFYTRLTCVHVQPAQPTPSIAPALPCETHPAQRPSITLVGKPYGKGPHSTDVS